MTKKTEDTRLVITEEAQLPDGFVNVYSVAKNDKEAYVLFHAARDGKIGKAYKLIRKMGQKRGPVFVDLHKSEDFLRGYRQRVAGKNAQDERDKKADDKKRDEAEYLDRVKSFRSPAAGLEAFPAEPSAAIPYLLKRIERLEAQVAAIYRGRVNPPRNNQLHIAEGGRG
jgi:lipopolysaccharide biosynthesis protein